MFHDIPNEILVQMKLLEDLDKKDREDGTPKLKRLRQIPPETGKFLAILAASSPEGLWIEIGTSAGYSSLWISRAAELKKQILITHELLQEKVALAKITFQNANVSNIKIVEGDAVQNIRNLDGIGFCFLDAEKDIYQDCYDIVIPKLVSGGLLIADNVISHAEELSAFVENAMQDSRIDASVVPIGKGELVCRKI